MLLGHPELKVVTPCLRAAGNIVTGHDVQTQAIIDAGVLPMLMQLLSHPKSNLKKVSIPERILFFIFYDLFIMLLLKNILVFQEAAWAVSNITAGTQQQIQCVIDAGLLKPLVSILQCDDFKSQKEAVWAITNLTSGGSEEQIITLLQAGIMKPICDLLIVKDTKVVLIILDAVRNMLQVSSRRIFYL